MEIENTKLFKIVNNYFNRNKIYVYDADKQNFSVYYRYQNRINNVLSLLTHINYGKISKQEYETDMEELKLFNLEITPLR